MCQMQTEYEYEYSVDIVVCIIDLVAGFRWIAAGTILGGCINDE